MFIEKEIKDLRQLAKLSAEEIEKLSPLQEWILKYRLNGRQKFGLFKPSAGAFEDGQRKTFPKSLNYLPIILGFSQVILNKVSSEKSQFFFEKNLPLFKTFQPKINFETFEYIVKSNTRNGFLDQSFLFGQPKFLAKVRRDSSLQKEKSQFLQFEKNQFHGLACDYFIISSGNFLEQKSNQKVFRDLDELPSYLKAVDFKNHTDSDTNALIRPLNFVSEENGDKTNSVEIQTINPQFNLNKKIRHLETLPKPNQNVPLIKRLDRTSKTFDVKNPSFTVQTQFSIKYLDFYKKLNQLQAEVQNLISEILLDEETNIQPDTSSENSFDTKNQTRLLKQILNKNLEVDKNSLLKEITKSLTEKYISPDFPGARLMSGYKYPDMTTADLQRFYTFNPNSCGDIGLERSSLPSETQHYEFNPLLMPKILIETKHQEFRHPLKNSIVYEGPTLVLDSKKAWDWKISGKQTLRGWFDTYISPFNSLNQRQDNFFGNYYDDQVLSLDKTADFDFQDCSLFSRKINRKDLTWGYGFYFRPNIYAPSQSILAIPSIKENDLEKANIKGVLFNLDETEENVGFVPFVQIQEPKFKTSQVPVLQKGSFQGYSSLLKFGLKGNPDFHFSLNSINEPKFLQNFTSGEFSKTASIFSQKQLVDTESKKGKSKLTTKFIDKWEPLNSNSWLILTQLSFAFFSITVLKAVLNTYGKEFFVYLLNLVSTLDVVDPVLRKELEIMIGEREKGYRVILNSQKTFNDVIGIEKLLPELSEVVGFLRTSSRTLRNTLPHGILLTGPPGTGKTLLVQALAGETQVPVVVISGSALIAAEDSGASNLELAFQEAKQLSPSILFIDEIDSISVKRMGLLTSPMGGPEDIVEYLTQFENAPKGSPLDSLKSSSEQKFTSTEEHILSDLHSDRQRLKLLTQFLIEVDGIRGRDGVVVIGATNRPEVLDPALVRPGRLEKMIEVALPTDKKRIEILQFYTQGPHLVSDQNIPWDYLAARTDGFSAADLAALMNEATMKAILNIPSKNFEKGNKPNVNVKQTLETIEHGIDRLISSQSDKYTIFRTKSKQDQTLLVSSKMEILRFAYYQTGKLLLTYFLETHPKLVFASLWPRRPTMRSVQITTNLQNSFFDLARLCEINDRLVGSYGGKAAEFLFLSKFSTGRPSAFSTLGLEDFLFAQKLVYCILDKWKFYSKKSHIQNTITLRPNLNTPTREYRDWYMQEKIELYSDMVERIEIPPMEEAFDEVSSLVTKEARERENAKRPKQFYYGLPWWLQEVSSTLHFTEKNFNNATRLYLYNSERTDRNVEWLPPNEFYHTASGLKNITKAFQNLQRSKGHEESSVSNKTRKTLIPWNELSKLPRDYQAHSLVLQSFNKALFLLNQNRELLDRLVLELLYNEILRQPEVDKLVNEFQESTKLSAKHDKVIPSKAKIKTETLLPKKENRLEILESSWGTMSRKPIPRWIDFANFSRETT